MIPVFFLDRRVSKGVCELAGGAVYIKRLNKNRVVKDYKPATKVFGSLRPASLRAKSYCSVV